MAVKLRRLSIASITVGLLAVALVPSCGGDEEKPNTGSCNLEAPDCAEGLECQALAGGGAECLCSPEAQTGCEDGEACEAVANGNSTCFAAITVQGRVFDLATDEPIEGARVVARDANDVAVSGVVVSAADGTYELVVPTPRDADGNPQENLVTLRADALGFLTFPESPRVAIPVDTALAEGEPLVVETTATDIGLIALQDSSGLGTVSGTVVTDHPAGTLVVAGAATALADRDGTYVVFNVPAGSTDVSGYKVGLQLVPTTAEVTAGAETEDVDLVEPEAGGEATAVVNGNIQIVNAPGGSETSVILVVESTFDADAARGQAPPGLRVGGVSGDFSIEGVPDGTYVVLAAFENDDLVRDPDTSIGGTDIVTITVSGANVSLDESFKVTEALEVVSPDGEQVVAAPPTFVWADDSGEDHYEVAVFDAFGTLVWEDTQVPGVSGGENVEVVYGGPALESGVLYQFRATSIKGGGTPLSRTEDLRGVFIIE